MSFYYLIPLKPVSQVFNTSLLGVTYQLTTKWNDQYGAWTLDIDDANSNPLVHGLGLVTGCDILEEYFYLNFGGGMFLFNTSGDQDAVPGYNDLGVTSQLYFFSP